MGPTASSAGQGGEGYARGEPALRTKRFNEGGSIIARRLWPGVKGLRGFVGGFDGETGALEAMTEQARPVRRGIVTAPREAVCHQSARASWVLMQ